MSLNTGKRELACVTTLLQRNAITSRHSRERIRAGQAVYVFENWRRLFGYGCFYWKNYSKQALQVCFQVLPPDAITARSGLFLLKPLTEELGECGIQGFDDAEQGAEIEVLPFFIAPVLAAGDLVFHSELFVIIMAFFTPILAEKKRKQKKKDKKVLSLLDLRNDKSIMLSNELLLKIISEAPLIINMWSRVASCIIGLPNMM